MPARLLFLVLFVYSSFSFAQESLYVCAGPGEILKVEVIQSGVELNSVMHPVVEFKISKIVSKPIEELAGKNIEVPGYSVKLNDQGAVIEVSELKMFSSTLTCIPAN